MNDIKYLFWGKYELDFSFRGNYFFPGSLTDSNRRPERSDVAPAETSCVQRIWELARSIVEFESALICDWLLSMMFPWSFREHLCTSHLKTVNILPWCDRQWGQVNSTLEGRQSDLIGTYGLVKSWVQLCCSLCAYVANHLTFPCLKFSTNRMGMGAFSCAPETLGDGKHQGVKKIMHYQNGFYCFEQRTAIACIEMTSWNLTQQHWFCCWKLGPCLQ